MTQALDCADHIAKSLKARGVARVFALCGGHVMPVWMALDREGIEIVDVRDERGAVYMAHAHAVVSGGFGVALVTAGPGVMNAVTGIANAHMSRVPVLVISGVPPRPQEHRGALQDMSHVDVVRSITRYARTVRHAHAVPRELDLAIASALGHVGEPGPAFIDFPVDVMREALPPALAGAEHLSGVARPMVRPTDAVLDEAAAMIAAAERLVVIAGRGANAAPTALAEFLTVSRAAYLDTGETKGLVPESHVAHVGAVRGAAMTGADLVVTVGRKLDFQLAYGSAGVFGQAKFLRIADTPRELFDNRLGEVPLLGEIAETLHGLTTRLRVMDLEGDRSWFDGLAAKHRQRAAQLAESLATAPSDPEGRLAPNRVLGELRKRMDADAIVIADGGDILSFARVALSGSIYLDPGPLGCIGIATAFAIGAAKAAPGRQVVAVTGDGSFAFTAMELDTAVRHRVPFMIVVSNNGAWAIEVRDQRERFDRVVGTRLRFSDYAAMARGLGMKAFRIEREEDLPGRLDEAFAALRAGEPVLIDAVTSPDAVSSDSKSGLAWVPDHQALEAWDQAERAWLGLSD